MRFAKDEPRLASEQQACLQSCEQRILGRDSGQIGFRALERLKVIID